MHDRFDDELARRRAARRGTEGAPQQPGDEEPLHFTWKDTLAMIIAAYQILMPIVLVMAGILLATYFVFRWFFS